MIKTINPTSALEAIQKRAIEQDGMPAFLARKPGDAPPNRPMTAPKVPTLKGGGKKLLEKDGTPPLVDQAMTSLDQMPAPAKGKGKKKATAVVAVKVAPAVAEGAYPNGRVAEHRTGITEKRRAAGVKAPKRKPAPKAPVDGEPRGKGAKVIELMTRKQGATIKELCKATGWIPNSAVSFIPSRFRGRYTLSDKPRGKERAFFLTPKRHRS